MAKQLNWTFVCIFGALFTSHRAHSLAKSFPEKYVPLNTNKHSSDRQKCANDQCCVVLYLLVVEGGPTIKRFEMCRPRRTHARLTHRASSRARTHNKHKGNKVSNNWIYKSIRFREISTAAAGTPDVYGILFRVCALAFRARKFQVDRHTANIHY